MICAKGKYLVKYLQYYAILLLKMKCSLHSHLPSYIFHLPFTYHLPSSPFSFSVCPSNLLQKGCLWHNLPTFQPLLTFQPSPTLPIPYLHLTYVPSSHALFEPSYLPTFQPTFLPSIPPTPIYHPIVNTYQTLLQVNQSID